jgi:hypothetical protein
VLWAQGLFPDRQRFLNDGLSRLLYSRCVPISLLLDLAEPFLQTDFAALDEMT